MLACRPVIFHGSIRSAYGYKKAGYPWMIFPLVAIGVFIRRHVRIWTWIAFLIVSSGVGLGRVAAVFLPLTLIRILPPMLRIHKQLAVLALVILVLFLT